MRKKVNSKISSSNKKIKKSLEPHYWRRCPYGEHWVSTHPMQVPPSEKNPGGSITTRKGHCAKNPSGKDQLYPDEIKTISNDLFKDLKNMPCSLSLNFKNGSKYDDLIAGWTSCNELQG